MSIWIKTARFLSKIRVSTGWLFFILVAITGKVVISWPVILVIAGGIIRTIAAGTIKKNETLANTGIYEIVRHPLYFGSFNISLGFCLMCNNIFLWAYFLIFFPLCYGAAIFLEEKYLEEKFKEEFQRYKKSVPAFFPLWFHLKGFKNNFSWKLVLKNDEHHNWVIIFTLLLVLIFKTIYK